VIHLAAISNDPMGKEFEEVTYEVNYKSSVALAKVAKKKGVGHFVFASSCSIYGFNDKKACDEKSELNPLTAYAKSKVYTEQELEPLADENFIVTCCRFATACGASPRIRLDLVLNDFVASAIATNKITILSDGTPWRPLINTIDMSRALEWGSRRSADKGGNFLAVNTGTGSWNYQVKDLALEVQKIIPGVEISINSNAQPDKRSYKVDFSLFESLAGASAPQTTLADAIRQVREVLEASGFLDTNFRASKEYIRLNMLRYLQDSGRFDKQLF
ncbi:MAG: hypothetical protein QG635_411, partial [Bacteroidota bacterium]|nr:hypothetical protein [Bacteroidota bacterium]